MVNIFRNLASDFKIMKQAILIKIKVLSLQLSIFNKKVKKS